MTSFESFLVFSVVTFAFFAIVFAVAIDSIRTKLDEIERAIRRLRTAEIWKWK